MIVIDASVAVLGLLNDGEARGHLVSDPVGLPHLADSEVVHALRAHVRRGEIEAADGQRAIQRWSRLGIHRFAVTGLLDRVWVLRSTLSAYDATYVALAEALGSALLTADVRLSRAPGPTCPITIVRR